MKLLILLFPPFIGAAIGTVWRWIADLDQALIDWAEDDRADD